MGRPILSVLMPNYNHSKYIGEALKAILSQSYRPDEIIIIDDASTDNSVEIIHEYVEQNPIVSLIVNEKNIGVVHNLNKLLELAKGDYVYFAAADDKILPGFFERSMNLLLEYPQAGLCSTLSLIINEEGINRGLHPYVVASKKEAFITTEKAYSILNKAGTWLVGNTTIYRKKALIDCGGFIPELHSFSDAFIQQVIALKYGACFIPEPLACWRRMDSGYASSTGANPDIMKEITYHAVHLMQTTYSNLFSKGYISDFEKVQFFLMNLNQFNLLQNKKYDLMRYRLKSKSILEKLLVLLKRSKMKLVKLVYIIYLFVKIKPKICPIIVRRFSMLAHLPIFYSSRKIKVN